MKTVVPIRGYKTSDGMIHGDPLVADHHQAKLNLLDFMKSSQFTVVANEEIVEYIVGNWKMIKRCIDHEPTVVDAPPHG